MASVNRARQWYDKKEWYRSMKIPWRRGWLIYGISGSGKSMLIRCVAQDLDIPLFVYDLGS